MMRMMKRDPAEPTPICRCRVLYLGSSVPQVTKDGLQGIQEPLRELYPAEGAVSARGIDSWLSVWSNGLLLENVDENQKKVTRFFPIESLHYCAAVRYVLVAGSGSDDGVPRFLPLDSPFARNPNISHPPLFACIMRRTTGIKVLECHAFICKRETAANALVRCCFHSYADSMYVRSLENGGKRDGSNYEAGRATEERAIEIDYTGDLSSVNSEIIPTTPGDSPTEDKPPHSIEDENSIFSGDENHKVWAAQQPVEDIYGGTEYGTLKSGNSVNSIYGTNSTSRQRRPRQMIMRSVAPPPPPSESDKDSSKGHSKNKSKKDDDEISRISNGGPPRMMNGSLSRPMNGHTPTKKGKIPRLFSSLAERKPKSSRGAPPFVMIPPHRGPPPHMMPMSPHGPPHHMMPPGPPPPLMMPPPHVGPPPAYMGPPPHMGPPPPPMGPHPHMGPPHGPPSHMGPPGLPHPMMPPQPIYGYTSSMPRRPSSRAVEEPIYMPSARPMSPTASYQPGHFPHERYLMQQYATTGRPNYPTGKKNKKKGNNDQPPPEEIYGRRGHMNEKAFAQSIRAEHRARSYTSLAGLGADVVNHKDREILQMVHDLDLSGDEIERVEARPGVYRPSSATVASRNSRTSRR